MQCYHEYTVAIFKANYYNVFTQTYLNRLADTQWEKHV